DRRNSYSLKMDDLSEVTGSIHQQEMELDHSMPYLKQLRVVAAENNKPMLDKVVLLLQADFEVVATAGDGNAALEMIELLKPDVAVFDISTPNLTGLEVHAPFKTRVYAVKAVIFTV